MGRIESARFYRAAWMHTGHGPYRQKAEVGCWSERVLPAVASASSLSTPLSNGTRLHDFGRRRLDSGRRENGPRRHRMKLRIFQRAGNRLDRRGCGSDARGEDCAATTLAHAATRKPDRQKATGQADGRSIDRSGAHAIRPENASPKNREIIPSFQKIGAATAGTLGIIGKVCLV